MKLKSVVGVVLVVFSLPSFAGVISVDGNLEDWGVNVKDCSVNCQSSSGSGKVGSVYSSSYALSNTATFGSYNGSGVTASGIYYHIEDTNDLRNNYQVGPNSGGQNYDAQYLGVLVEDGLMKIAISSGQRPDNGSNLYAPGDIILNNGSKFWGIEVGGGIGNGSGSTIDETADGYTYVLNGNGYTTGSQAYADGITTAGSLWSNPGWILDPIAPKKKAQIDHANTPESNKVTTADYVFTRNSTTSQHSIIELSFELSSLQGLSDAYDFTLEWHPSCGNDELSLSLRIPRGSSRPLSTVPEPAVFILIGIGLAGIGFARKRITA